MSKGKIWITRSQSGAKQSKATWEAAGFKCFVQPVIDIAIAAKMPKPLPENAVLLVSSQNALHILKKLTDCREWPVMTVGDASANLARKMGFEDVLSAKGNAKDGLGCNEFLQQFELTTALHHQQ